MKLSAPIHQLKRQAKIAARNNTIPLHAALDAIARREGFASWSLLAFKSAEQTPASRLYASLGPGNLLLVGARPGQGKTLMSLELAIEAMKAGHHSHFFSLEYAETDIAGRFAALGIEPGRFAGLFHFDGSDAISADYIAAKLAGAEPGTLVVVDYLQLLDQRRDKPDLQMQVSMLQALARQRGLIIVFVSQVDRAYDPGSKAFPGLENVRLPNPLDLTMFNKTCFMHGGSLQFSAKA